MSSEEHFVLHGDHNASYAAPSADAKELAAAIRERARKEGK